jgi:hypothetical protein
MPAMGSASSQVQMEEDIDASKRRPFFFLFPFAFHCSNPAPTAAAALKYETPAKPAKKTPRTYSKRKRAASPEGTPSAARPLNLSTAQDKVGSAKRRRADKENEDVGASLSGKENKEPDTSAALLGSQEQEHEEEEEQESSSPPMKKKKAQGAAAAAPPSPPPTQQSRSTPRQKNPNKKISQRTLEARLTLPEQTFQPGHVSETNEKKTGWFSPQEIKTLEKYKTDFCLENVIDNETFDQCIQASSKDRVDLFKRNLSHISYTEFWNSIYLRLPRRDRRSIRRFMRRHFQAGRKPHQWTAADDNELQRLHQLHGPKWSIVASEMERTHDDVVQRWKNKVEHRSTMRGGPWSKEEVEKLVEVIEKSRGFLSADKNLNVGKDIYEMDDKYISWGAVSDFFGNTRSRQQCADKWRKVRSRVIDARQTGIEDATYLEVYDFSVPRSQRSRSKSAPRSSQRKKLSLDYVNSDDDNDDNDDGSDDDNLSVLGRLPPQTFAGDEDEEDISTQEPQPQPEPEPDRDNESANNHHPSPNPEPSPESGNDNESNTNNNNNNNNTFSPNPKEETQTQSTPTPKKQKRSKAEKAEQKAAAKAAAKAERKRARRAQKRAILETREASIKRESS